MSIPSALVTVTLKRIRGLSPALLGATTRVFAVATVGRRVFGRSRQIASTATEHDLMQEPLPWREVVQVDRREPIPVTLVIYDDHDRGPARELARITGRVQHPYDRNTVQLGRGVTLDVSVVTRFVPSRTAASVPRRSPEGSGRARVRVPSADAAAVAVVELFNIRGLYRPGTGNTARRSIATMGYRSGDHRGRVFTNTALSGAYRRDTQQIELRARVHVRRGQLPSGTQMRWRLVDIDDPFDADPRVARQWLHLLDDDDYDAHGVPQGAHGGDNHLPPPSPPWHPASGFAMANPTANEVTTTIVGDQSVVVLDCPRAAGDNFMVVAELAFPSGGSAVGYEARTGIMTMWHRVFVEYVRMPSALPLPIGDVADVFEPAFIEMNFAPERVLTDDRETFARTRTRFGPAVARFVDRHFEHARRREPGWFFLAAARRSYSAAQAPIVYPRGPATLASAGGQQYVDIATMFPRYDESYAIKIYWTDGGRAREAGFIVQAADPHASGVRLRLFGNDYTPGFTAGDGGEDHAYASQFEVHLQGRREGARWVPPGYGAPHHVEVEIQGRGGDTMGRSPTIDVGGSPYFGGRTIIFTHHSRFAEERGGRYHLRSGAHDDLVYTMAHELCHAFGMPHKCGLFDVYSRASARGGNNACLMNYSWHPLLAGNHRDLISGTDDRVGRAFCGRHLREMRRVQLQNNRGLRSVGW